MRHNLSAVKTRNRTLYVDGGKVCARCKVAKPPEEFGLNKRAKDGRQAYCAACAREVQEGANRKRAPEVAEGRAAFKRRYVELLGGKCVRCGYSEFLSGLDFHHINPEHKDTTVSTALSNAWRGRAKNVQIFETEIAKCVLLCRNCHSALHAGEWAYLPALNSELIVIGG